MRATGRRQSARRYFLFALTSLCAALATLTVAEAVLRCAAPDHFHIRLPGMQQVFHPAPDLIPGVSGDGLFAVNAHGFRGDELAESQTYRILALGGSTTEGLYLDQSEAWPQLVQQELNQALGGNSIWVGNAGLSGRTIRHHVAAMKQIPWRELRINAVVMLVGVNDLTVRLSQDADYDPEFMKRPGAAATLLAETFEDRPLYLSAPDDRWVKRTAIWQLMRKVRRRFAGPEDLAIRQDTEGAIYQVWRAHRQSATEIRDSLPDLSAALDEYAGHVRAVIDIARQNSLRVIFVTQPTIWRPDLPDDLQSRLWLGGIGDFQKRSSLPYYSVEALAEGMSRYNRVLLDVCREKNVECYDLAACLEKDGGVFFDDVHFNERGAAKVANLVSEYLLSREPFHKVGAGPSR